MPLFVMAHRPGSAWEPGVPYPEQHGVRDHFDFMRRLAADGVLRAGGPYADGSTDPVGMAIVEVEDLAAAEALGATDASVRSALLTVSVRPWDPRMGSWLG